jgi:hypothetical protein
VVKSVYALNNRPGHTRSKQTYMTTHSPGLILLTTVGGVYRAYGHFLITASWVAPHFTKMLIGMENVGLTSKDTPQTKTY